MNTFANKVVHIFKPLLYFMLSDCGLLKAQGEGNNCMGSYLVIAAQMQFAVFKALPSTSLGGLIVTWRANPTKYRTNFEDLKIEAMVLRNSGNHAVLDHLRLQMK